MNERTKASIAALVIMFLLWFFLWIACGVINASECDHTSDSFERFDAVRILPPATITFYDGKHFDYLIHTKTEVRVGRLEVSKDTVMDKVAKKQKYWIVICERCKHVYFVSKVSKDQWR